MTTKCPRCFGDYVRVRPDCRNPTKVCIKCRFCERGSERRLSRAINRTLTTLPALRYRGECIICGAGMAQNHDSKCPVMNLELALLERGQTAYKESKQRATA